MRDSVASYYLTSWTRTAAFVALAGSMISLFVLSGSVLDSFGYKYDVEGGGFIDKVHPATFLVALSLVLRIVSEDDVIEGIKRIFLDDGALLVALAAVVILEAYVIFALRVPITPPFDAYLLPILYCFALRKLNARWARALAIILLVLFAANAVFAIYERLAGTRLFFIIPDDITGHPEDPTMKFDWKGHLAWDWRSTAMLGHPLENAMMTGCLVLILQSQACRWIPLGLRCGMILLQLAAMLTFGGRVAIVSLAVLSAVWWALRAINATRLGHWPGPRQMGLAVAIVPIVAVCCVTLFQSGLIDKLIERFVDDQGSAQTRLTMWNLFVPIQWDDIFSGPNQDVVATNVRLEGLELGIESFWAGLPLTYGIIMTAIILTSWVALSLYLMRHSQRGSVFVVVFYFVVASTSAGLASKTTSLGFLVMMVLILMHRAGPRRASSTPLLSMTPAGRSGVAAVPVRHPLVGGPGAQQR